MPKERTSFPILPNLPIGPYRVEVSAGAFKTYVQTGIVLQVGNNVQVNAGPWPRSGLHPRPNAERLAFARIDAGSRRDAALEPK
jgi:hypothetical protein